MQCGKPSNPSEIPLNKQAYLYLQPSAGLGVLLFDDLKTNGLSTSDIDANAVYAFGSIGLKTRLNRGKMLPYLHVGISAHQRLYHDEINAVYSYQNNLYRIEILNTDLTGSFFYGPYGAVGIDFPAFNRLMGIEVKYNHLLTSRTEYAYIVNSFSLGTQLLF